MAQDVHTTHERTGDTDRRDTDRRRYNRRSTAGEPSPPYFEAFERIALALEGIQRALTPPPAPPVTGDSAGGTRRI